MTRFALLGVDAAERALLTIAFLTLGMFVFHKYQGQRFLYSKLIPIVEFSTIHFFACFALKTGPNIIGTSGC